MIRLFPIFILISVVLLQLLASGYASSNDLAVYAEPLKDGGIYEGDFSFELLQRGISALLGDEFTIYGLQLALLGLVVAYIYKIRRKVPGNMYMVAFLIFTSPVVLVGLTNSIRQSLAFVLIMLAFELRNIFWRVGLLIIAILMHNASLLLIPLLAVMFAVKTAGFNSLKPGYFLWSLGALFVLLAASIWYLQDIVDLMISVYDRYSVYINSTAVFTEGRVGSEKLVVWILFWFTCLLMSAFFNSGLRMLIYLIIPFLYTLLVAVDAAQRGFDEFHSRLLMFNNVFVVVWMVEFIKKYKSTEWVYFIVFVFNVFNPATIGVLI